MRRALLITFFKHQISDCYVLSCTSVRSSVFFKAIILFNNLLFLVPYFGITLNFDIICKRIPANSFF